MLRRCIHLLTATAFQRLKGRSAEWMDNVDDLQISFTLRLRELVDIPLLHPCGIRHFLIFAELQSKYKTVFGIGQCKRYNV